MNYLNTIRIICLLTIIALAIGFYFVWKDNYKIGFSLLLIGGISFQLIVRSVKKKGQEIVEKKGKK